MPQSELCEACRREAVAKRSEALSEQGSKPAPSGAGRATARAKSPSDSEVSSSAVGGAEISIT